MNFTDNKVALVRCPDYTQKNLAEQLDRVLGALPLPAAGLRSSRVLLKPNLISVKHGTLACTDGRFILAVADWFLARGAVVAIGDSPAFGTGLAALRKLGILESLVKRGVRPCEFKKVRRLELPCGQRVGLAVEALECDMLVNMPRVKAHAQMRVTMAVKNYFGCLVGMRKPWWHMVHGGARGEFASLLLELASVLPSGPSLVDGITAMHESGPIRGEEYALGIIAGCFNPVAVDTALLALLGIEPESAPLWLAAQSAGFNGLSAAGLDYPLQDPAQLRVSDFRAPSQLAPIRFSPVRFARGTLKRIMAK